MYYSYPEEYFFPVMMKNRIEFNLEENSIDELTRGLEESNYLSILDNIDDEYADLVVRYGL